MFLPSEVINKILIIRFSSLGDVLLTTPLIRAIKKKFPESVVDFLIKPQYCDAVKHNKYINNVILFDKENPRTTKETLIQKKYDLVIDLQNNFRSRAVSRGFNAKVYRFSKPTLKKLLLVWFKINLLKNQPNIPQRYAETLGNIELDQAGLELFYPVDIVSQLKPDKNYVGLCPGSKHFTKRWPPEYFIELGNMLRQNGYDIVILGGSDEKDICSEVSFGIQGSLNLCRGNNLFQTAADMILCKFVVCNDSGLMHTASAVGAPVIALFGSSVKEFGFTPYNVENIILENDSLKCRPCSHIGRGSCPKNHFKCMKEITPQLVYNNIQKFTSTL